MGLAFGNPGWDMEDKGVAVNEFQILLSKMKSCFINLKPFEPFDIILIKNSVYIFLKTLHRRGWQSCLCMGLGF